jgi:hypothetical protein
MSRYITENYSAKDLFSLFGSCIGSYSGKIVDCAQFDTILHKNTFNMFTFTPPDYYCKFIFIFCADCANPRDYLIISRHGEEVFCVPPRYLSLAMKHFASVVPKDNQKRFEEVMEHLLKSNPDFAFHLDIFI